VPFLFLVARADQLDTNSFGGKTVKTFSSLPRFKEENVSNQQDQRNTQQDAKPDEPVSIPFFFSLFFPSRSEKPKRFRWLSFLPPFCSDSSTELSLPSPFLPQQLSNQGGGRRQPWGVIYAIRLITAPFPFSFPFFAKGARDDTMAPFFFFL